MDQVTNVTSFKKLLESLPGMFYQSDSYGVFTFVSEGCYELIGLSVNELLGNTREILMTCVHPDDYVRLEKQRIAGRATDTTERYEYRIISREGVIKWVSETAEKVYDDQGKPVGREGYITEITEKKALQAPAGTRDDEDINAVKDFYENVINSLSVEIAVLDNRNKYRFVNNAAIKDAKVRQWIIGKADMDLGKLRKKNIEVIAARTRMYPLVDELKQPVEWSEELLDDKGNKRFYARTLKPFTSSGREYKIGYGIDITALKVIQDELIRRERLLSFSHKLAKIGYWVYYPRTKKHEWSKGVYDILGLAKDSIVPSINNYHNFIHPEDRPPVTQYIKMLEDESPFSREFRIVMGDGTVKYISEQSSSASSDTEEYVFGVIQDITETKQSIQERESLINEINNKYNDLMQFSYIVSHNLRSPVANILGMAYLFKMDLSEEERSQVYDYILESAQSIDTVIKDLNQVLSARSALNENKEDCSLSETIEAVCYDLNKQLLESKAVIQVDIAPDADVLRSIKSYIQSVFYNLISNAVKYRADGRDPEIIITARRHDAVVHIEVKDNGAGIDLKAHKDQIFGLYKRFTDRKEGRGLGLHMTKGQIESLGGTIAVESELGEGTCFKITLNASAL